MSPSPAAGNFSRSAGTVHVRQHVTQWSLARRPSPAPHPGQALLVGCEAPSASLGIALEMPPGRCQVAPESIGWMWVRGTSVLGVKVLKMTQNVMSYLVTWSMMGWTGSTRYLVRQPGPRQSTIVCVHIRMVLEQFDHKLILRFHRDVSVVGQGRIHV